MNLDEANKVRKELLNCHLKDASGNEVKRITIPNQDDSKYEGCALKIMRTKLDDSSLRELKRICLEHKLQPKDFEGKGYCTIYTPKKP